LFKQVLNDQTAATRVERELLVEELRILLLNCERIDKLKLNCDYLGHIKAKKRVTAFGCFFTGQYFLFNYLTYVTYSWDIIEPIVCVTIMFDAFLATLFYNRYGKLWDTAGISKHYSEKFIKKQEKKYDLDMDKYEYYKLGI
jgi:hypothetical protein